MRDHQTTTEDAAGRFDRASLYQEDLREHDEPGEPKPHECTSPDPAHCLLCVLDEVVAEQKAARA